MSEVKQPLGFCYHNGRGSGLLQKVADLVGAGPAPRACGAGMDDLVEVPVLAVVHRPGTGSSSRSPTAIASL